MKYTNRQNFPEALVNLIMLDDYDYHVPKPGEKFVISVTALMSPPQQVQLRRRHWNDIIVDVDQMIFAARGKSMHGALERANKTGIVEDRVRKEFEQGILTGKFDLLTSEDETALVDYKDTSIYAMNSDETVKRWSDQLNLYAYLARHSGYQVDSIEIVAFLRDFNRRHREDPNMPDAAVQRIVIEPKSDEEIERYINERLSLHVMAKEYPDHELPPCAKDEKWYSGDTYKIRKEGRKSSIRNLPTIEEAEAYCKQKGFVEDGSLKKGYSIELVLGENKRCNSYCDVKDFCHQFKQETADRKAKEEATKEAADD